MGAAFYLPTVQPILAISRSSMYNLASSMNMFCPNARGDPYYGCPQPSPLYQQTGGWYDAPVPNCTTYCTSGALRPLNLPLFSRSAPKATSAEKLGKSSLGLSRGNGDGNGNGNGGGDGNNLNGTGGGGGFGGLGSGGVSQYYL